MAVSLLVSLFVSLLGSLFVSVFASLFASLFVSLFGPQSFEVKAASRPRRPLMICFKGDLQVKGDMCFRVHVGFPCRSNFRSLCCFPFRFPFGFTFRLHCRILSFPVSSPLSAHKALKSKRPVAHAGPKQYVFEETFSLNMQLLV